MKRMKAWRWLVSGVLRDREGRARDFEKLVDAPSAKAARIVAGKHAQVEIVRDYGRRSGLMLQISFVKPWTEKDELMWMTRGTMRAESPERSAGSREQNPPSWMDGPVDDL